MCIPYLLKASRTIDRSAVFNTESSYKEAVEDLMLRALFFSMGVKNVGDIFTFWKSKKLWSMRPTQPSLFNEIQACAHNLEGLEVFTLNPVRKNLFEILTGDF